ncbi:hypothetical protein NP493_101g07016 [Ridgeia piscesae]|uniref:Vacuolar fusion protein CCZ1 homolog n=1 Tax=Ridgeia piscesae TaxID=27915 RepID=A0AAD9P7K0_RIDPI|nr:hypothetical protein NP493_101g07016 [Ridgeia piscesae]
MSKKSDILLMNFFIFNSTYGPKEGEEEKKILYFYPPATDIDEKIKQIGHIDRVLFARTFSDQPCESVHNQKTRLLFYEAEPNFWFVMSVSIPYSQRVKDGQTFVEYHEEDIQDSLFRVVLQQAYSMFKLFNGTFHGLLERSGIDSLKHRFEQFYTKYLLTLNLKHSDILDIFDGIHFLPLDKNTYLRIQCFINQIEAAFPQIKYTAFLYNDQVVWSGLEQEDMRVIYRYLKTTLFPAYMEQEFQVQSSPAHSSALSSPASNPGHYGKFILGPPNVHDITCPGKTHRTYLNTHTETTEECHLVVYRALSATICLFVEGDFQLNFDFWRKLDSRLGPQLGQLASDIAEHYAKRTNTLVSEPMFKYVYFNHMNLATKTTLHVDSTKTSGASISPELLRIICDLNHDLSSIDSSDDGEIFVKSCGDSWVVGKKSDQREFYVVINQKNANLIEINGECFLL